MKLEHGDVPFRLIVMLMSALVLALGLGIGYELWQNSALSREAFGPNFIWTADWDPVAKVFGAAPFWYGTLVTSLVSLILAVPVSLGIAIFLAEIAPDWLRSPSGFSSSCWRRCPVWSTDFGDCSCSFRPW